MPEPVPLEKKTLRKQYQQLRATLSAEQREQRLKAMLAHLQQLPITQLQYGFSYRAMLQRNEVPASVFELALHQLHPSATWAYPKTATDGSMEAYTQHAAQPWAITPFGTEEPAGGQCIQPSQLNIALIPLLCFDTLGFRVGYGKGFYDRYLARCKPDLITIGLSWFEPVTRIADVNANDVPLKYCITPYSIYAF